MTLKTLIGVIVLLVVLGIIVGIQQLRKKTEEQPAALFSVTAFNQTKNSDATATPASPNEVLVYTLSARNQSDKVISGYVLEINIEDISKLAILIDAQGANYNSQTNSLIWTPLDIPANGSIEKQFTVRIKDPLPADSDRLMTAKFNNEINVQVLPQQVAGIDNGVTPPPSSYSAPTTGPSGWLAILLASAAMSGILILRRKRLAKS